MERLAGSAFAELSEPLVSAVGESLGPRYRVSALPPDSGMYGIHIIPELQRERRSGPERHTLDLVLVWPSAAWISFAELGGEKRQRAAHAFTARFMENLSSYEAWNEFQLASCSQRFAEPIVIEFTDIG